MKRQLEFLPFSFLTLVIALLAACQAARAPAATPPPSATPVATIPASPTQTFTPTARSEPKVPPALISHNVLFGLEDKTGVAFSRDGTKISWLAPYRGALNVFVAPADNPDAAKPVTNTGNGTRTYYWAYTNKHVLYLQDTDGDENYRIYSVNVNTGESKTLTPLKGVHAGVQQISDKFPLEILVTLNERDPKQFDIYRVNIESGKKSIVLQNDGFASFITDDDFNVRFAVRTTADGGKEYLKRTEAGLWKSFAKISLEDASNTYIAGFDKTGKVLYMVDSRGRNTGALTAINLETGKQSVIAEDSRADVDHVSRHPTKREVQAVSFNYERTRWQVIDNSIAADLAYLKSVAEGDLQIVSRALDDKHWIVYYLQDDGPGRYYLYDREAKSAKFLFTDRKALEGLTFAKMHSVIIKSRDGLDLVSYLTLPVESDNSRARPERPLPMVLYVHGGPWSRDEWGFDLTHQWLANRGYAVLSVNYRGSDGFGKAFLNAGNKEWAGKMHEDLIDAVNWSIKEGIADAKKICIMGGSYGGYATLVGLTFTPEIFACGVDRFGPSNLVTLLNTIPPYWTPQIELWKNRVGDHTTKEGRAFLNQRSPLTYVEQISKPLLIIAGANDPRVKQSESDQIVRAMQAKNLPVTYLLYPDEGHGFASATNSRSSNAVTEIFFATYLGGRYEAIGGNLRNSSITVPVGANLVRGLAEALEKR